MVGEQAVPVECPLLNRDRPVGLMNKSPPDGQDYSPRPRGASTLCPLVRQGRCSRSSLSVAAVDTLKARAKPASELLLRLRVFTAKHDNVRG